MEDVAQEEGQQGGQSAYNVIEALDQVGGISAADIKKLKEAGYHTVEAVAQSTKKELSGIKGISEAKVEKLHQEAFKMLDYMSFQTAAVQYAQRQDMVYLTTGSRELDALNEWLRRMPADAGADAAALPPPPPKAMNGGSA